MHEASLYEDNLFLTLTYSPEHLPDDQSLDVETWKLFMKRLKKSYKGKSIRFYHCGEYGDQTDRPHYHAIIFNHDFEDKQFLKYTELGHKIYTSARLDEIWGLGDCYIGDVTFESAAYCARYVMKKRNGPPAAEHYQGRKPEYSTQSRRPGIGQPWLAKWKKDIYPHDYVVMNGKKLKPPKYYDAKTKEEAEYNIIKIGEIDIGGVTRDLNAKYLKSLKSTSTEEIKSKRQRSAAKHSENNTKERLAVREECHELRVKRLTRKI